MKIKQFLYLCIVVLFNLTSCGYEEGTLQVQNKVHNVVIQQISWGGHRIYDYLNPGETSSKKEIEDKKDGWPKSYPLEFYMTANGNKVYLKTRAKYTLDYDENLLIVIADTTAVYNPIFE